jgi:hypothetical protein
MRKTTMRVTWIGGWGVSPEDLRPLAEGFLPGADHAFLPPVRGAAEAAAGCDFVAGWSLGAWHVMEAAARGVRFRNRVLLLAPFVAFCSEHGLGGRCSQTQVRWLRRWLQGEPVAALRDFYSRAGLGEAPAQLPYATGDLLAGLDLLAQDASPALRKFAAGGLPEKWQAVIGGSDPLLDADAVARALPGCQITPGAGHRAEELLGAIRKEPHAV